MQMGGHAGRTRRLGAGGGLENGFGGKVKCEVEELSAPPSPVVQTEMKFQAVSGLYECAASWTVTMRHPQQANENMG